MITSRTPGYVGCNGLNPDIVLSMPMFGSPYSIFRMPSDRFSRPMMALCIEACQTPGMNARSQSVYMERRRRNGSNGLAI